MLLQDKQIDRMVLKVRRLEQMYADVLVKETLSPTVTVSKNGKDIEVKKGYRWGKDFACENFSFIAKDLKDNEKYYVFADAGSPEYLIYLNGKKIGMLDYVPDAFEPPARTHRYVLLDGLKNGDKVTLELSPYDLSKGRIIWRDK